MAGFIVEIKNGSKRFAHLQLVHTFKHLRDKSSTRFIGNTRSRAPCI